MSSVGRELALYTSWTCVVIGFCMLATQPWSTHAYYLGIWLIHAGCISSALGIVTKGLEQVLLWLSCLGGVVLSVLLTGFAARSLVVFVSGQCVRDRGIAWWLCGWNVCYWSFNVFSMAVFAFESYRNLIADGGAEPYARIAGRCMLRTALNSLLDLFLFNYAACDGGPSATSASTRLRFCWKLFLGLEMLLGAVVFLHDPFRDNVRKHVLGIIEADVLVKPDTLRATMQLSHLDETAVVAFSVDRDLRVLMFSIGAIKRLRLRTRPTTLEEVPFRSVADRDLVETELTKTLDGDTAPRAFLTWMRATDGEVFNVVLHCIRNDADGLSAVLVGADYADYISKPPSAPRSDPRAAETRLVVLPSATRPPQTRSVGGPAAPPRSQPLTRRNLPHSVLERRRAERARKLELPKLSP